MAKSKIKEKQQMITEMEIELKNIKDVDVLLEKILTCARKIVNADAGSIYEYDSQKNLLYIRYSQNDTLQKRLPPGEKLPYVAFSLVPTAQSISGYCVVSKNSVNIADAYNMDEYLDEEKKIKRPYSFNSGSDLATNYHTTSMLTIPLLTTNGKVLGVLQIINAKNGKGKVIPFDENAVFYINQFATKVSSIYEYAYLTRQSFDRLIRVAEFRDPKETGAHVERVSSFSVEIYDRYAANKKIPEKEREKFRDTLSLAARCHDVGKVAIPDEVLKKNGILNDDERSIMKGHTCVGAQIFSPVENDLDLMSRDVCLHHHDRYDGGSKGYPGTFDYTTYMPATKLPDTSSIALSGEDIPLAARIVALADVYDALRHKRCYKDEWSIEDTFNVIKEERGKQFDPELVDVFFQVKDRLEAINKALS